MEARVNISAQDSNFRNAIGRVKKELSDLYSEVSKNNGKWTDDFKKKLRELEKESTLIRSQAQTDFEKSKLSTEKRYRSGEFDSRDRSYNIAEARYQHQEDRVSIGELSESLSELNRSLTESTTETRQEKSVFRALMTQKILGYTENMLNSTQNYGPMAGFNPGNIFGSAVAFGSRGETFGQKLKYGLIGAGVQAAYEGFTKSLKDGETLMRSVNDVRGLGKDVIQDLTTYMKSTAPEFVKYGVNASDLLNLQGSYARLTGGNMSGFKRGFEVQKAYGVDLSNLNSLSRYTGTSGGDMALNIFRRLSGVGRFSESNTSTSIERLGVLSQLISGGTSINENVDANKVGEIQAIFARGLGNAGNTSQAGQVISAFNNTISNPSSGAQQIMSLRAAQRAYPQYANDISQLNRRISEGIYGENGRGYAQELTKLISGSAYSDSERRLVADQYFGNLPISVRDSLMKGNFFDKAGEGGGFGDFAGLAQQNTFFSDVNQAEIFNLAADVGEDVLKTLYAFTTAVENFFSAAGKKLLPDQPKPIPHR